MLMAAINEDKARLARSLEGDPEAFEALVREHQRMIHSLCYRMSGSLADADDLAQETFVHAYRHLAEFRDEARFSSWLYRIAVNQCLNWQRRRQRQQELNRQWAEEELASGREEDPARAQRVQEALMKLNPKQRVAMILTTYDGMTHAQAAQVLRCSETTVSWRLFAGRRKLKSLLKDLQPPRTAHEQ
jgi:RNA polymerase sigma-70 factor (ECF subfamily)